MKAGTKGTFVLSDEYLKAFPVEDKKVNAIVILQHKDGKHIIKILERGCNAVFSGVEEGTGEGEFSPAEEEKPEEPKDESGDDSPEDTGKRKKAGKAKG